MPIVPAKSRREEFSKHYSLKKATAQHIQHGSLHLIQDPPACMFSFFMTIVDFIMAQKKKKASVTYGVCWHFPGKHFEGLYAFITKV